MCLTFSLKAGKHSIGFKLIFHFPPPASKTSDLIDVKEAQLTLKQCFSIIAAHFWNHLRTFLLVPGPQAPGFKFSQGGAQPGHAGDIYKSTLAVRIIR